MGEKKCKTEDISNTRNAAPCDAFVRHLRHYKLHRPHQMQSTVLQLPIIWGETRKVMGKDGVSKTATLTGGRAGETWRGGLESLARGVKEQEGGVGGDEGRAE